MYAFLDIKAIFLQNFKQMLKYAYLLELHYRYGKYGDDNDFFEKEVIAESDEEAKKLGRELRKGIFNVFIINKKIIN